MPGTAPANELQVYLRQVSTYALLTVEQERSLAWRIINDGDRDARDALVNANLRLVIAISRRYQHRGLSLGDLIAEGNVGLVRAAEGFDPARGVRFSTYATLPIKQAIRRAIFEVSQSLHVPSYMAEQIRRYHATIRRLEAAHNRTPSLPEIAEAMVVPLRSLHSILRARRARARQMTFASESEGGFDRSADLVEDQRIAAPDDRTSRRELVCKVVKLLELVGDRDARVLRMRYGLGGQKPLALCQISRELGITSERVRQVELEGRRKLHALLAANGGQEFLAHLAP